MSLIPATNSFAMLAIIFGLAWLGFWIDQHPTLKKTSGVVWVLMVSMLLSNFNIIPLAAPSYDFVGGTLVPLAIPLLLFKADLRKIFSESGRVMLTFCIASMATVIGAVVGFYLLDLGEIGPKVAGVYTGGWIGGAVNMLSVSQAVEMTDDQFSVAVSASSVVSITALMLLMLLPSIPWILKFLPTNKNAHSLTGGEQATVESTLASLRLTHVAAAIAISCVICATAALIGELLDLSRYNILFITLITIIVANVFPQQLARLEGDFEMGMLLMYLFFAIVGAGTDAVAFLSSALILFVYGMMILIIHLTVVLGSAKLLKVDLAEAIIASAAALVGPAPTAAVAMAHGWRSLVTPGIMCGIFGYVIATFIGVSLTALLS